ncbi:hypothetical protein GOP47_0025563 [Adiantum capillus-veneris]|uniref:Transcription initiation factor TFIID subunit 2 n=1 Tax=Adiantum capillus-veneris TaxID=13818 RepID=A0A9D4Z332_ADICA|nr:hypothetical protein GOP47_0025563 [Adiantum capillus-veneris]
MSICNSSYAELKVVAPTRGVVGLHAQGLNIQRVLCDGVPTEYEVLQALEPESFKCANFRASVQQLPVSATEAADASYSEYLSALEKELAPELLIFVPEARVASHGKHDVTQNALEADSNGVGANGNIILDVPKEESLPQPEERVKLVHVEYWLEKLPTGGHFLENLFHTSNQQHRARCWFPCVDLDFHRCSYEMEFTVDSKYKAVSSGKLLYKVEKGSHLVTYVYSLDIPVAARFISLVVAPLKSQPDQQNVSISHFCIPTKVAHLQCTVSFFSSLFSFYEDYLGASFPFGSYSHVFVDSELMTTSSSVGAAITILSSHLMVDERVIDQTMNTRIKLAHALAQQWFGVYISPESPSDEWLLDGLCVFLTDMFIKRHFGNNEAYYRHFKANEAVCKADIDMVPPLSCPSLHGTQRFGILNHIYSWKSVAVIHMLEKQMGPDAFRKILQRVILRAQDPVRKSRTLSAKEFRHFANRLGNLERPFLKEFFPRWVEFQGCPVLRMGFEYNKRRNMIELAVFRSCTASSEKVMELKGGDEVPDRARGTDAGWPGMMSIRVHEIDGMYDHPSLPMSGDTYQLLEIHCHSKLAGRRIQRPKKGSKADGAEEAEQLATVDSRQGIESPLLWLRADPQMEYLSDIQLQQPEQMWINQLEKDKDVVAQLQAISALSSLSQITFGVLNALNSCLNDTKIFFRVRIEAAFALARTAKEANGWIGLSHLLGFYKGHKFDPDMGLPRPNDFRDLPEYFVLEAIPQAVASVRGADGKSPPEAVEFILQLLKHNDNSGNQFSDVFWISSIITSVASLEFGQQSIRALSRILKRFDRFLQYDRIMPSYNHLLTTSCIQTLTKLALKFSVVLPLDQIEEILLPFKDTKTVHWKVRSVVLRALLELEIHFKGLDSGINLAFQLVDEDPSMRVQTNLFAFIVRLSALLEELKDSVQNTTLFRLIFLLQSREAFGNAVLRHHVFCILQILAGRPATLFRLEMRNARNEQAVKEAVPVENPSTQEQKLNIAPAQAPQVQQPETPAGQFRSLAIQPQQLQTPDTPAEQFRIRLVNTGAQPMRDTFQTMSTTSSGKQESERRVKVLKLKLKPTVSTQDNVLEDTRDEVQGTGAVQSSSISVDMNMKKEAPAIESPHSIMYGNMVVKEESDGSDRVAVQKERSSTDRSSGKNGEVRKRQKSISLNEAAVCQRTDTLDVLGGSRAINVDVPDRSASAMEASVSQQHDDVFQESEYSQGRRSPDTKLHGQLVKPENEGSLRFNGSDADDGAANKQKKKKRMEEERKSKKREREKDKHKHGASSHDKRNDPEYREKKRLKKERKRLQQMQEQLRQQEQLQGPKPEQQQPPQRNEEEAARIPAAPISGIKILPPRPSVGTSDTVVRLKIKRL